MAEHWRLQNGAQEGPQTWACWTTVADIATANTAGQITAAPDGVRKGDVVWVMAGCTAVTTQTTRAAFTSSALLRATADAAAGALDLSDDETMADAD